MDNNRIWGVDELFGKDAVEDRITGEMTVENFSLPRDSFYHEPEELESSGIPMEDFDRSFGIRRSNYSMTLSEEVPISDRPLKRRNTYSMTLSDELRHTIWVAIVLGDLEFIKRYVDNGHSFRKVTADGRTILHLVCSLMNPSDPPSKRKKHMENLNLNFSTVAIASSPYYGEHPAHLLVLNRDIEALRLLVEAGANLKLPRASGSFYNPPELKNTISFYLKSTTLYWGETVLAFASILADMDIVRYLIEEVGFDINTTDSKKNTVMHILAWWGANHETHDHDEFVSRPHTSQDEENEEIEISSVDFTASNKIGSEFGDCKNLGKIWKYLLLQKANMRLRNDAKLTPFLVAVARGNKKTVNAIFEDGKKLLWDYQEIS
ncbi:hypothetical protein HK096_009384, partial [Nowakowskiella sp. JEL0078]